MVRQSCNYGTCSALGLYHVATGLDRSGAPLVSLRCGPHRHDGVDYEAQAVLVRRFIEEGRV